MTRIGPHTFVSGMTGSGKSTLVRRLIVERFKPAGCLVFGLDPKMDPRFQPDFSTDDPDRFMAEIAKVAGEKVVFYVDECAETVGSFNRHMRKLATMYRELGFRGFFITQRPAQVDKNITVNCGNAFLFRHQGRDVDVLRRDYGRPEIANVVSYRPGQYLFLPEYGPTVYGSLF